MSAVRVYLSGNPVHDRVLESFFEGCPNDSELVRGWKYEPSEVAVIFGVYKSKVPISFPRGQIFQRQRAKNLDVVVLETGYINRGDGENHHYAAGFNGLNGRADFRNRNMPDDRAILLRRAGLLRVLNWREKGAHVLLCGQVPWDASVEGSDHLLWLQATVERLKAYTDREIVFRPHPKAVNAYKPLGCRVSTSPLREDLETAHAVVTYNSNTGVEALIEGVPVFAADQGSMCWELANKSLLSIDVPNMPDRVSWLNDLCYAQWNLSEMRSGEAWAHLSR
jgi:hypothetical protein